MARSISINSQEVLIAPSVLSANPLRMAEAVNALSGEYDMLHVDIMDGHFVPNLSYGPDLVRSIRKEWPDVLLDTHLMVERPQDFVDVFADAGTDILTVHVETAPHLHRLLEMIKSKGCVPGVSINPGTPVEWLKPVLPMVGLVLVMSVNPGFGGQSFIPDVLDKVKTLKCWKEAGPFDYLIEIDGGISTQNVGEVVRAGCDVVVAGSAIFKAQSPYETAKEMRRIAAEAKKIGR